jgi:protein-tyrosine-phosphatase
MGENIMTNRIHNALFLCTGNSARSIMAEAILNETGQGKFRAYSAGSQPKGAVNPNTIKLLQGMGYDVSSFRSKSWDEFAKPGAPSFDFIITVCDDAANEPCPVWPGKPMTAHWGVADPAAVKGTDGEIVGAFREVYTLLLRRIELLAALKISSLDQLSLQARLCEIGRIEGAAAKARAES